MTTKPKSKKNPIRARLKDEDGSTIKIYDDSPIKCEVHGTETTWGDLDPIEQLAVKSGLDTSPDAPCLLAPKAKEEE